MTEHVQVGGLQVAKVLFDFVNNEAIPGTGLTADKFWEGADKVIHDLAPKNKALLAKRDDFQARIDAWHQERDGQAHDAVAYKAFLQEIGYLLPEAADFQATTQNVDDEIARTAGPQLVVPVMNARFALNASNARWGSLYDALYGTDAISEDGGAEKGKGYNKVRGDKVIAFARAFLDEAAPLAAGSHVDSTGYKIADGKLLVTLKGGSNSWPARRCTTDRFPGRRQRANRDPAETQRSAFRNPGRRQHPGWPDRRRRRQRHPDGSGADHHHGLRRLRGGRRC